MRSIRLALVSLAFTACTTEPTAPPSFLPPDPIPPSGGKVPVGGGPIPFSSGGFTFTGPTAPGSASVTDAPVVDPMGGGQPAGGAFDMTIDGINYADPTALSMATVITDDTDGKTYAVWAAFQQNDAPDGMQSGTMVEVIVPVADAVAGNTVALDGDQRIALFFSGDMGQTGPSVGGAAISGTVTFGGGTAAIGSTLTASVAGDFGPIDLSQLGGGGGGGGGGTAGNNLVSGDYMMTFQGPAQVYCQGTLMGHEADFAGVTLVDLGFGSGQVTVTNVDATHATIAGPSIQAGFGESPLALGNDGMGPDGELFAVTTQGGAGPGGTTKIGHYLAVDASGANATGATAGAGAGYTNAASDGTCSVSFQVAISNP